MQDAADEPFRASAPNLLLPASKWRLLNVGCLRECVGAGLGKRSCIRAQCSNHKPCSPIDYFSFPFLASCPKSIQVSGAAEHLVLTAHPSPGFWKQRVATTGAAGPQTDKFIPQTDCFLPVPSAFLTLLSSVPFPGPAKGRLLDDGDFWTRGGSVSLLEVQSHRVR